MMSWLSSNLIKGNVRERTLVTLSGLAPDIDGFGLFIDLIMKHTGNATNYWGQFHHSLHNIGFCITVTVFTYFIAKTNKIQAACLSFAIFHLHLFCDLIGSKGPDGYQWPIPYLQPFSNELAITWRYQWELNAWPNILIGLSLLVCVVFFAKVYLRSPFEIVSKRANDAFIQVVCKIT